MSEWYLHEFLAKTPIVLPDSEEVVVVKGLDRRRQFGELTFSRQSSCSLAQNHGRDSTIKLNGRHL